MSAGTKVLVEVVVQCPMSAPFGHARIRRDPDNHRRMVTDMVPSPVRSLRYDPAGGVRLARGPAHLGADGTI